MQHWWSTDDNDGDLHLTIDWFDVLTALQAVLQFLFCSCMRNCSGPSKERVANNIVCTNLFHARRCQNQQDELVDKEESFSSDDEEDDNDDNYDSE